MRGSHLQAAAFRALGAENAAVARDLLRRSGGLFRIVGKLHGRAAVHRRDLADQRDGGSRSCGASAQPRKSLVRLVPQPIETPTRPRKWRTDASIESMSMPSESTTSFWAGSTPRDFHHAIASSAASIGALESGRMPRHFVDPVRRVAQKGGGAIRVRQKDEKIAAIVLGPVLENLIAGAAAAPRRCRPAPHRPSAVHAHWCRWPRDRCPSPSSHSTCR